MLIEFTFEVDGVPTNATSVKLSDPTSTYGLRRTNTGGVIVADNTAMTNVGTGMYEYQVDDGLLVDGVVYDYWSEAVYAGNTFRVQHFRSSGGTAGEVVDSVTLRFVLVDQGDFVFPDSVKLSSPTGSFGAIRTDTGETIVVDGTDFDAEGTLYSVNIPLEEEGLTARYYVEAVYDDDDDVTDPTTWHLPRVTSFVKSAALVLGRYTNSYEIETYYGVENVHKMLGIDEGDEAVDYALRMWTHIEEAEQWIDDELRPCIAIDADDVPRVVSNIVRDKALLAIYEARGSVDMDDQGFPTHRYSSLAKKIDRQISKIKHGQLRISGDTTIRYPSVITDDE